MPLHRHDSYGRPLPHLTEAPIKALAEAQTNVEQRERLLRRVQATMEEHYPHLLRRDVNAEVTITFKVEHGIIQEDLYVGIVRHYRQERE